MVSEKPKITLIIKFQKTSIDIKKKLLILIYNYSKIYIISINTYSKESIFNSIQLNFFKDLISIKHIQCFFLKSVRKLDLCGFPLFIGLE